MLLDRIRILLLFIAGASLPQEYVNLAVGQTEGVVTVPKVTAALLVGYAIVHWAARGKRLPRSAKHPWIVGFFLSVFLSLIVGAVSGSQVRPVVLPAITWTSLLAFYFVMAYVPSSRGDLDVLFKGLALGSLIVVMSTYFGIGNVFHSRFGERTGGAGGNPNMLAFNMCTGIPMFGMLLVASRRWASRGFYGAVIAACLAGIVVSLSRAGALALAAMGGFWMVKTKRVKYAIPVILAGLAFLALVPETWFERVGTISLHPKDASARHRIEMVPMIFQAFKQSPVLGLGISRFVPWTYEKGYTVHNVIHNAYFQVLAEQGLLGLIPFLGIHVVTWRELSRCQRVARSRALRGDPELNALALRAMMVQTSFVAALLIGLFSPSHNFKALWLMFGISTVMHHLMRVRARELLGARALETPEGAPEPAAGSLPAGSLRA